MKTKETLNQITDEIIEIRLKRLEIEKELLAGKIDIAILEFQKIRKEIFND